MQKNLFILIITGIQLLILGNVSGQQDTAVQMLKSNTVPLGSCPLVIINFTPTAASVGDTVTIQLINPCEVDSVSFGGVAALSITGTPQYTAIVKAVVANGSSGVVRVKNQWGSYIQAGFTFLPPAVLPKVVKLCPPVAGTTLNAELAASSYQWQVSTDSINYTNISVSTNYDSVNSAGLILRNIPSAWSGRRYRCVTPANTSRIFKIIFQNEWTLNQSSSWENAANWSCGSFPDENTNVVINSGITVLSSNVTIKSLNLLPGSNFSVAEGFKLTVLQ